MKLGDLPPNSLFRFDWNPRAPLPPRISSGYYRVLASDRLGNRATLFRALISLDKHGREIKDDWAFNDVDVFEIDRESIRIVKSVGFNTIVKYDRAIWSLREAARDLHMFCPHSWPRHNRIQERPSTPMFWVWEVGYFPPKSIWKILMTED